MRTPWNLLRRLAAFYPDWEIARILNRQKRVTARGLPFTASRVAKLRGRHGIAVCPAQEADASGVPAVGVSEAAAELGVKGTTLYRWIRKGLVPSVQPDVSGAPVRVRLTDDFRSRFCPTPPDGFVPLATAVRRLGVFRQAIWKRMRVGEAAGHLRNSRQPPWAPCPDQPEDGSAAVARAGSARHRSIQR